LSWFIAAQSPETDPGDNDYLTSKWPGLIRPLLAGFHSPLTFQSFKLGVLMRPQCSLELGEMRVASDTTETRLGHQQRRRSPNDLLYPCY
jgi:hypothetical protein